MSTSKNTPSVSGVMRSGKGYIVDGKTVNGRMVLYKQYRSRIEAMERELGFTLTKKGRRVSIKTIESLKQSAKRDAAQAELPEEPDDEQAESQPESAKESSELSPEEAPADVAPAEEAKKKAPKMKKKAVKRTKK